MPLPSGNFFLNVGSKMATVTYKYNAFFKLVSRQWLGPGV